MMGLLKLVWGASVVVASLSFGNASWAQDADFVILGEFHDNPHHHQTQVDYLAELAPKAVVFEMLSAEEASLLDDTPREPGAMRAASAGFHWSNIEDYADVLAHSPVIVGAALPRADVRKAFSQGAAAVFGDGAKQIGLNEPLPADELANRKQAQFQAHCEAMPLEMMGGMVEAQRLRDAHFARVLVETAQKYGEPVVLITGNGHARRDWGVPRYIAALRPDATIFALGQSEAGAIQGVFDLVLDAAPVERSDPCAAFK